MIRFINLSGQITLDPNDEYFAWYDTVTSNFVESWAGGMPVFDVEGLADELTRHDSPIRKKRTKDVVEIEKTGGRA